MVLYAENYIPVIADARAYISKFPVIAPDSFGNSSIPYVTVSPKGLSDSGVVIPNNGAQFGPDTAGTVTSGLLEAINYVISLGGGTIKIGSGVLRLTKFTDTVNRAAISVDSGYRIKTHQPIVVNIEGATPVIGSTLNILTVPNSYPSGSTIIDGSALDVLQYGLYKQGRIFFVPPKSGGAANTLDPINALYLRIANMVIIPPVYNASGSGASYTIQGYGTQSLFLRGDSVSSNTSHFEFVNAVDAWCASGLTVEGVSVQSAIAAYNPNGNQYAGGGGIRALGSAAGFVYPNLSNQGNNIADGISTFDIPIGAFFSSHVSCNQFYVQNSRIALYAPEGGHGSVVTRINVQQTNFTVQHALLPQLTTSFSGATPFCYDPRGDEYAMAGLSFPSSASTGKMIITDASMEAPSLFLNDDVSNPLTLIANVEATGTITPSTLWGSGANLMINFIDASANAQQTLVGTTAGTITYSQSGCTPWDKRFVAYLNGYENTTGTEQTITFWIPYNNVPAIVKDATVAATTSATVLTLPKNMVSPITGYIIIEGY